MDITKVRYESKVLLKEIPILANLDTRLISHPFVDDIYFWDEVGDFYDLTQKKDYSKWITYMETLIDTLDVYEIFFMVYDKNYVFTWLKYIETYVEKDEFDEMLSIAWSTREIHPKNYGVKAKDVICWFKNADKKIIMREREYKYWENLPDAVELYRVGGRCPEYYDIAWTPSLETARWLQSKMEDSEGSLFKVIVPKEHCICCFDCRDEYGVIVDIDEMKNVMDEIGVNSVDEKNEYV